MQRGAVGAGRLAAEEAARSSSSRMSAATGQARPDCRFVLPGESPSAHSEPRRTPSSKSIWLGPAWRLTWMLPEDCMWLAVGIAPSILALSTFALAMLDSTLRSAGSEPLPSPARIRFKRCRARYSRRRIDKGTVALLTLCKPSADGGGGENAGDSSGGIVATGAGDGKLATAEGD